MYVNPTVQDLLADALLVRLQEESSLRVSIDSLCADCYIHRSTFYYHFGGVEDLLQYLFERDLVAAFEGNLLGEGMAAAMGRTFAYLDAHAGAMQHVIGNMTYATAKERFSGSVREMFRRVLSALRPDATEAYMTYHASLFTGLLTDLFWTCLTGRNTLSPEELTRFVAATYEALLPKGRQPADGV